MGAGCKPKRTLYAQMEIRVSYLEGHMGHSVSDKLMVCESPLRFRWSLAHLQIMPKKSVPIVRDVGQAVSETFQKWKKGRFFCDKTNKINVSNFFYFFTDFLQVCKISSKSEGVSQIEQNIGWSDTQWMTHMPPDEKSAAVVWTREKEKRARANATTEQVFSMTVQSGKAAWRTTFKIYVSLWTPSGGMRANGMETRDVQDWRTC